MADSGQPIIFLYSCIMGLALGGFYEIFKILRKCYKATKIRVIIEDTIFMTLSGIASFLFILVVNFGQLRFYILAGEIIGFCAFMMTLDVAIMYISSIIIQFVKKVYRGIKLMFIPIMLKIFNKQQTE